MPQVEPEPSAACGRESEVEVNSGTERCKRQRSSATMPGCATPLGVLSLTLLTLPPDPLKGTTPLWNPFLPHGKGKGIHHLCLFSPSARRAELEFPKGTEAERRLAGKATRRLTEAQSATISSAVARQRQNPDHCPFGGVPTNAGVKPLVDFPESTPF